MKKEDAIKYLQQLYPNGGHCWLDEQRIEAINMAVKSLQEEPVSGDLEDASRNYADDEEYGDDIYIAIEAAFKAGAKWQKGNLWKPADGDDLPEIDREVIAILDNGKIVFAHRPPEFWDGKDIITGKVTRYYPKTYDKGGWNIPDVKWWLDCNMDSILKRNDENNKIDKR